MGCGEQTEGCSARDTGVRRPRIKKELNQVLGECLTYNSDHQLLTAEIIIFTFGKAQVKIRYGEVHRELENLTHRQRVAPALKLDQIVLERRQSQSGALLNRYSLLIFRLTGFNLYSVVLCLIFSKDKHVEKTCALNCAGLGPAPCCGLCRDWP